MTKVTLTVAQIGIKYTLIYDKIKSRGLGYVLTLRLFAYENNDLVQSFGPRIFYPKKVLNL